jgi:hypothetical protein
VKKTELIEVTGSLEHINLNLFYEKVRQKLLQEAGSRKIQLEEKLQGFLSGKKN